MTNNITEENKPKHKLRFKCFSDIHWKSLSFIETYIKTATEDPDLDAVFICGDCGLFDDTATNDAIDAIKEKWPSAKIFYVPGNHDQIYDNTEILPFKCRNIDVLLMGDGAEPYILKDVFKIYGFRYWECDQPYHINRLAQNGMCTPEEMKERVKIIPDGIDILLTHTPAEVLNSTRGVMNMHFGSHQLQLKLEDMVSRGQQPKYHIFGHIHGSGGNSVTTPETNITSINCAVLNEGYNINPEAVALLSQTFELEK